MASDPTPPPVIGATAYDRDGKPVGTITTVFLDDVTGQPTWVGLTSGQHAAPASDEVPVVAPIADTRLSDGEVQLTVSAAAVRSAPRIARPDHLTPDEEVQLREHYRGGSVEGTSQDTTRAFSPPAPGDTAMTLSEERLQVSTVIEPWTRAVLRIEEYTEEIMVPVTVTRQRALVEHLPVATSVGTPADPAVAGGQRPTNSTGWVTLFTEEPQVSMQRVPVERVRLNTAWVAGETAVTEQVRHEEIELSSTDLTSSDTV
jgi:stress response protein YsnF